MISVYYAKKQDEVDDVVSPVLQIQNVNNLTFGIASLENEHTFAIICGEAEKQKIVNAIDHLQGSLEEALKSLVKYIYTCLEKMIPSQTGDQKIYVFIHFGQQDTEKVQVYNQNLSVAIDNMRQEDQKFTRLNIFAVSRYNRIPSAMFSDDNQISFPEGNAFQEMLASIQNFKNAKPGDIHPKADHLRAIAILCQAFSSLRKDIAKEKLTGRSAQELWQKKGLGKIACRKLDDAFDKAELKIIRNDCRLFQFCNELIGDPNRFDLSRYDDLSSIARLISSYLRRLK